MEDSDANARTEEYLLLLNEHERAIASYIHTLVNDPTDAEDILQACRLTLWKKFGDFKPGTSFLAWARKVALHQILNYRRSTKRKPVYTADPALVESIAAEIDRQSDRWNDRSEALRSCLLKLPEPHRQTIVLRYFEGFEIEEIARETNRSEGAVYRLLSRIRSVLGECVAQEMEVASS